MCMGLAKSSKCSRLSLDLFAEANPRLVRLRKWMKLGVQVLFVIVLAGILVTSALACPMWIGAMNQREMPCSRPMHPPDQCPLSICQASSPYLASHESASAPVLQEQPTEAFDSIISWTSAVSAEPIQTDVGSPPGSLFLRTHSLLI